MEIGYALPTTWHYIKAALLCMVLFVVAYLVLQNTQLVSHSPALLVPMVTLVIWAWLWLFNYLFSNEYSYTGWRLFVVKSKSRLRHGPAFFLWGLQPVIIEDGETPEDK